MVAVRAENAAESEPVRSWSDLRWKLLGAAFDHKRVVLIAKGANGPSDFQLDLRGVTEKDVDDDFMSRLGFEPGGGKLTVAGVQPGRCARKRRAFFRAIACARSTESRLITPQPSSRM